MKVIGLTGGIGSGKSTASTYLKEKGIEIIDADLISREVVRPGMPLLGQLAEVFGADIVDADGELDRKTLGSIVFLDEEKRRVLDRLMHGMVIDVIRSRAREYEKRGCGAVIIDVSLLFEVGLDADCDEVWVIVADEDVRIRRVGERDGLSPKEVRRRIDSQMSDEEKATRADVVIDNSGDKGELYQRLDELLQEKYGECANAYQSEE